MKKLKIYFLFLFMFLFLNGTAWAQAVKTETGKADLGNETYNAGKTALENQNYVEAFKLFETSVKEGNIHAYTGLGDMYYYGYGVPIDYATALDYYKKSLEQGSIIGSFKTGLTLLVNYNDCTNSFDLLKNAEKKLNDQLALSVGDAYASKVSFCKDAKNYAKEFYLIAKAKGNKEADAKIDMLEKGISVNAPAQNSAPDNVQANAPAQNSTPVNVQANAPAQNSTPVNEPEAAEKNENIKVISVDKIVKDYLENEFAADKKYKGKEFIVEGYVESIGKDMFGNPTLTVSSDSLLDFGWAEFSFKRGTEEKLSNIQKGEKVKIKGTCKEFFGFVIFINCTIL